MVDATMLREQILGTIVSIIHSPCGYRSRNQLTNLPANAKVLHNLYQHASPAAARYAEADVIVASHRIGTFSAHLVRTRTDQAGLAVTLEVRGWKTHVEALEALFNLSRDRLSRAFEASEDMGGKLGNWELLDLK
jgi:predicted lipoprotein